MLSESQVREALGIPPEVKLDRPAEWINVSSGEESYSLVLEGPNGRFEREITYPEIEA